jgi:hypothetical protein
MVYIISSYQGIEEGYTISVVKTEEEKTMASR